MRNKGLTARPAARTDKGTGSRTKKTVAVASRKSQPIIQMVERSAAGSARAVAELPKKTGELPIPSSTFVF